MAALAGLHGHAASLAQAHAPEEFVQAHGAKLGPALQTRFHLRGHPVVRCRLSGVVPSRPCGSGPLTTSPCALCPTNYELLPKGLATQHPCSSVSVRGERKKEASRPPSWRSAVPSAFSSAVSGRIPLACAYIIQIQASSCWNPPEADQEPGTRQIVGITAKAERRDRGARCPTNYSPPLPHGARLCRVPFLRRSLAEFHLPAHPSFRYMLHVAGTRRRRIKGRALGRLLELLLKPSAGIGCFFCS